MKKTHDMQLSPPDVSEPHRSPSRATWRAALGLLVMLALFGGILVPLSHTPAHAATNSAVTYADSHWNCANVSCSSTVSAGSSQPNFQCAEFVARALSTEGLVPGLNSGSSQSAFGNYHASNGRTYDLLWVGWTTAYGYNPDPNVGNVLGLYQYLTQNGIASDIGNNPGSAAPGDAVIYHEGDGHTALMVQAGSNGLVDAHNNARYHVGYTEGYSDLTILHMVSPGSGNPPPTQPSPPGTSGWPNVTEGATGENVVSIQLMLLARGYSLSIDGDFGPQTLAAVKAFQADHGLGVDGQVGPQTWPALIVQTSQGSSGPAVEALQRQLNDNGANVSVDSSFGPLTNQAVRNFQSSRELSVDGQAGPQTWVNLVDHIPPVSTSTAPWPNVTQGASGENVYSIQLMLQAHGYSLGIDGSFGPETLAAVKAFQSDHGLSVDGQVGPQTWPALIIQTSQGSSGSAVLALQRQLNANGAGLTVDGSFGPATATAVRNYQSSRGLGVDGVAGPQTWVNLVDHTAGTPSPSSSWPNVTQGASGENVYSIQLMLQARGYSLGIDGDFGPETAANVQAFQAAHNLGVDGQVGPQTWPALIVQTSQGSSGSAVEALQRQLNAHGQSLSVDGSFGPLTAAAVRSYQSSHNLGVDGIAGPQTWQSLVSNAGTSLPPPTTTPPSGSILWGFDTTDFVNNSSAHSYLPSIISQRGKPDFIGRYIDALTWSPLGSTEAAYIHNQGIKIMVLDSSVTSNDTTYATGVWMANRVIAKAQALGIPTGVAIFSDIEAGSAVDSSFIQGWYDTISASGYKAGYYLNPYTGSSQFSGAFCTAISSNPQIASQSILWSPQPSIGWTTKANAPGFAPAHVHCNGNTAGNMLGWQYSQPGGGFNIDNDEIDSSVPLW